MSNRIKEYIDGEEITQNAANKSVGKYKSGINAFTVSEFLSSGTNKYKKIPNYQRPYSWEKKHISEFLTDILTVSKEDRGWFLGTLFIVDEGDDTVSLLDGQQRITSIYLICREILGFEFNEKYDELEDDTQDNFKSTLININNALYLNNKSRFIPEQNSDKFLKKYLEPSSFLNRELKFQKWEQDLNNYLTDQVILNESESQTTLRNNIETIRGFLNEIIDNDDDVNDNYKNLIDFSNTLLNDLFFIIVPLKDDKHSIEFFEGLNNRGKKMSLVDRLSFKSLTWASKLPVDDTEKKRIIKTARDNWKGLYVGISKLISENKCYLRNHEEFFSDYFTANAYAEISNDKSTGKSDNDQYVELFIEDYLQSEETLLEFFQNCNQIITVFENLSSPVTGSLTKDQFLNANDLMLKKKRIQALFLLTNKLIEASKNTRYLIICLVMKFSPNEVFSSFLGGLWNIVKLIFWIDFVKGYKSNKIRTTIHRINKLINGGSYAGVTINYTNFFKLLVENLGLVDDDKIIEGIVKDQTTDKGVFKNESISKELGENDAIEYLATKNNTVSGLILYLYTYIINHNNLVDSHPDSIKDSSLEHIFPSAYKANWQSYSYTKKEVEDYYKEIKSQFKFNLRVNTIKDSEDFELKPYTSSPFIQHNALNQWIGNKLVILASENSSLGNKSFSDKKNKLNTNNLLVVPEWHTCSTLNKSNIKEKTDWNYKEIIFRSIHICDIIFSKIYFDNNNSWDTY